MNASLELRTACVSLSVVVCTFNRAELLDRVLGDLAAQTVSEAVEVIVVDNASTDATPQVLRAWAARQTLRLTTAIEPGRGYYARARNRGLALVRGDVVAFVDDDVRLPPDWAAQLLTVFADRPDVACLGGPVEAEWESLPPPPWITRELLYSVSVGHYGSEARALKDREYPIGANMAFRAGVLRELGGFDPHFGRIGPESIYCDEVEIVDRLRRRGKMIHYDPHVRVSHFVPASRVRKEYFLRRRWADGRSIATWETIRGGKRYVVRNAILRIGLTLVRDVPGYVVTVLGGRPSRFTYACRLAKLAGYLKETLLIASGRRRELLSYATDGTRHG